MNTSDSVGAAAKAVDASEIEPNNNMLAATYVFVIFLSFIFLSKLSTRLTARDAPGIIVFVPVTIHPRACHGIHQYSRLSADRAGPWLPHADAARRPPHAVVPGNGC